MAFYSPQDPSVVQMESISNIHLSCSSKIKDKAEAEMDGMRAFMTERTKKKDITFVTCDSFSDDS